MDRRAFVVALLCYLTLDLSLAAMPGAFVFESDESVEGTLGASSRLKSVVTSVLVRTGGSFPLWQPRFDVGPRRPAPEGNARLGSPVVTCLPRASCVQPQPSEDPH